MVNAGLAVVVVVAASVPAGAVEEPRPAGDWVSAGLGIFVPKGTTASEWKPPATQVDVRAAAAAPTGSAPLDTWRGFIRASVPFARALGSSDGTVIIGADNGASDDPAFALWPGHQHPGADAPALRLEGATELFVGREGTLYARGEGNRFHRVRQKFVLEGTRFREVPQPFRFVGLRNVAQEPFDLHAQASAGSEVVARVGAGQEVEVLVADSKQERWFLARTPFGLVGWAECALIGCRSTLGLSFHGD